MWGNNVFGLFFVWSQIYFLCAENHVYPTVNTLRERDWCARLLLLSMMLYDLFSWVFSVNTWLVYVAEIHTNILQLCLFVYVCDGGELICTSEQKSMKGFVEFLYEIWHVRMAFTCIFLHLHLGASDRMPAWPNTKHDKRMIVTVTKVDQYLCW